MRGLLAALLVFAAPMPAHASDFLVRQGLWQIEVAAPQGGAKVSYQVCVRSQRPREAFKFLPSIVNPELQCQQVEFSVGSSLVRWQARCDAPVSVEAYVDLNYREEELFGVTRVFIRKDGQEAQTVQTIRAKRIGECN